MPFGQHRRLNRSLDGALLGRVSGMRCRSSNSTLTASSALALRTCFDAVWMELLWTFPFTRQTEQHEMGHNKPSRNTHRGVSKKGAQHAKSMLLVRGTLPILSCCVRGSPRWMGGARRPSRSEKQPSRGEPAAASQPHGVQIIRGRSRPLVAHIRKMRTCIHAGAQCQACHRSGGTSPG